MQCSLSFVHKTALSILNTSGMVTQWYGYNRSGNVYYYHMIVTTNGDYEISGSHSLQKLICREQEGTSFVVTSETAGPTTQFHTVGDIKLQTVVMFLRSITCLAIVMDKLVVAVKNVLSL
jgi:hypothetical protein